MKLVSALLLVVLAMSTGCSDDAMSAAPAPTPDAAAAPTVATSPPVTAPPTVVPDATATPTATPSGVATPTADPLVVRVEFPEWVDESPRMALRMATSDVIARARLNSLESTTTKFHEFGFQAVLIYKFRIVQYLKGDGANEVEVRIGSGPKARSVDVYEARTESEARDFARSWLYNSRAAVRDAQDAVLFLQRSTLIDGYLSFTSYEDDLQHYPAYGETWLAADGEAMYQHKFMDGELTTISSFDLKTRIGDLSRLTEGEYGLCVIGALYRRDRVRRPGLGTYREETQAGYREPEPFPRYEVAMNWPVPDFLRVFVLRRPPYVLPIFSDYWLDGRDRDLFAIRTRANSKYTYESIFIANSPPRGEFQCPLQSIPPIAAL